MFWYTFTVYFLLAKRLGGVILVGDDNSDRKSVLDLWWSPGCNELSGCKNWMRGMWTDATNKRFLHAGFSLAETPMAAQWVHDNSEAPTTTQHGWVASKIEYEDHVLLLEHDSDEEQPECFPNGLVKLPNSTLNARSINTGSVLLIEQCVKSDGGSIEHFGTVTRVHHDGTHAHASTESLTHDDVQSLMRGGSASFLLPLGDEIMAEDASSAAKQINENKNFLERGTLQRVVKSSGALGELSTSDLTSNGGCEKKLENGKGGCQWLWQQDQCQECGCCSAGFTCDSCPHGYTYTGLSGLCGWSGDFICHKKGFKKDGMKDGTTDFIDGVKDVLNNNVMVDTEAELVGLPENEADAIANLAAQATAMKLNLVQAKKVIDEYKKSIEDAYETASKVYNAINGVGDCVKTTTQVGNCGGWGTCDASTNSICIATKCVCGISRCNTNGVCTAKQAITRTRTVTKDVFNTKQTFTDTWENSATAALSPSGDGLMSASVAGSIKLKYTAVAQAGAKFFAALKWTGTKIDEFAAGVTGTASLSLKATATLTVEAAFHIYLLNLIELNLGDFLGLPMLKLSIMPVIALEGKASIKGVAQFNANWDGKVKIGNDASSVNDDEFAIQSINNASSSASKTFSFTGTGSVNVALKFSIVCSAGIDIKVSKALASISATFAAEFEGKFDLNKTPQFCAQFQLTTHAGGTLEASFFWWAWKRRFTLKKIAPIKLCNKAMTGRDSKDCTWDIGPVCEPARFQSMIAVDSSQQLDDYYHNL